MAAPQQMVLSTTNAEHSSSLVACEPVSLPDGEAVPPYRPRKLAPLHGSRLVFTALLPPWRNRSSYENKSDRPDFISEVYKFKPIKQKPVADKENVANGTESDEHDRVEQSLFFYPTLGIQRYLAVISRIKRSPEIYRTIVDVGCAGLRFLNRVKDECNDVRHMIGLDIDLSLLDEKKHLLVQPPGEYLEGRSRGLDVELLHGSIFDYDSRLAVVDMITAIEVIEHLQPDDIAKFEAIIFGMLLPFTVIVTTPNVEFNPMFRMGDRKFRHWDHKFEWTRAEFAKWAEGVIVRHPEYVLDCIEGVGAGPHEATDRYGCASQLAVFRRYPGNGSLAAYNDDRRARQSAASNYPVFTYETVLSSRFLSRREHYARAEKIRIALEYACENLETVHPADGEQDLSFVVDDSGYLKVSIDELMKLKYLSGLVGDDKHLLINAMLIDPPFSSGGGVFNLISADGVPFVCFKSARNDRDPETSMDAEDFQDENVSVDCQRKYASEHESETRDEPLHQANG